MIDATLDFAPKELSKESVEAYFKQEIPRSEFALLAARNQYQAQLAGHYALLEQRDRLLNPKTD